MILKPILWCKQIQLFDSIGSVYQDGYCLHPHFVHKQLVTHISGIPIVVVYVDIGFFILHGPIQHNCVVNKSWVPHLLNIQQHELSIKYWLLDCLLFGSILSLFFLFFLLNNKSSSSSIYSSSCSCLYLELYFFLEMVSVLVSIRMQHWQLLVMCQQVEDEKPW